LFAYAVMLLGTPRGRLENRFAAPIRAWTTL
jgi:hypothetical protein